MSDSDDQDDIEEVVREIREEITEEELEPTAPEKAFTLWLESQNRAESTMKSYRYRVKPFLVFCEENDIETLDELTTRHIKEFESERRGSLQRQTINNQFGTLKLFLRYCQDLNAVSRDVVRALDVPRLSKGDRVNTEKLIRERAERILENLDTFRYATREHVVFLLLWRTTMRIGALRSLDLEDLYLTDDDRARLRRQLAEEGYSRSVLEEIMDQARLPFLYPRHRPETGTRLKNKDESERVINIADWVAEVIRDFIRVNRFDVTDDYGRAPLLTTRKGKGRLSRSAIRNWIYMLTQPCEFGAECPHDRDPEECAAREHGYGSKCPSAKSPHKLRTGSITWHRDEGWPVADLSDKADTGEDLIEDVYDQPEKIVRGAARRVHLDKLEDSDS